ncbi:hypothetical protein JW868_03510, partial [Candidatus Woesearchaeota archaeon]|nr:hypothetical protein [Candidatus Woesearchaeota archaeon]
AFLSFIYSYNGLLVSSLLLFLFLYYHERPFISQFFFFFGAIFNPLLALIFGFVVFGFFRTKNCRKYFVDLAIYVVILASAFILFTPALPSSSGLAELFSDFGYLFSYSLFFMLIGLFGLVKSWDRSKIGYNFGVLGLVLISYWIVEVRLLVSLLLAYYIALVWLYLWQRKWLIASIKYLTLLLVVCSFLFYYLSFTSTLAGLPPENELRDTLKSLRAEGDDRGVLTHYSLAPAVAYYSGRHAIPASKPIAGTSLAQDINEIYYSRTVENTSALLDKYDIRFVLITDAMKSGLVWDSEDQGILFLLHNSNNFNKVHVLSGAEIWLFRSDSPQESS